METALYYTLSTIAQTLAGALGILVAVVLFKLSALRRIIDESKAEFTARGIDVASGWPVLRDAGLEAFFNHLETHQSFSHIRQHTHVRRASEAAHMAYHDWGRINFRLTLALAATMADIMFCFIYLPFTPKVAPVPWHAWSTVAQAVLCGAVCLALYAWLIAAMVKRPAD